MDKKITLPFALALVAAALTACSSNTVKVKEPKPNPLPKLVQSKALVPVFSQKVSATAKEDPLRLQLDSDNGVNFIVNPKGEVAAYRGKQRLWETRVNKHGLTSGVEAAQGIVLVGSAKGELYALDQATGQQKWQAQLTGALLSPPLIQGSRAITIANDGTVFAHDIATGQQLWAYKMPSVQFSLRGQPSPVMLDSNIVLIASANAYVYGIDVVSGVARFQRRVAVSEGRSDSQRLIDIDGDPVVRGQYLITTSYQGQVTVTDLAAQQVVWSENASSNKRPEVANDKVFVSQSDGSLVAYNLSTGEKVWQSDVLLHRHLSNPVVLGSDLVVGDLDGYLHLINPDNGQLVGRSKTDGDVLTLRVIDNQLYASTRKGEFTVWQNR